LQAAQRELPEAHDLFDDAKHRLDGAFALTVTGASLLGFQGVRHLEHRIVGLRRGRIGREAFIQRQMMRMSRFALGFAG